MKKMMRKITFIIYLLFGLMFINAGLNKFFNYMPVPENLPEDLITMSMAMVEIGWLMPLVAIVEIAGGILFMAPRTRALGALIILPVMTGILLTHIIVAPSGLPTALALLAVLMWGIIENREKYLPLFKVRTA